LKIISYKIESPIISNKIYIYDKNNSSENKSLENSSYLNKENNTESKTIENNNNIKNYIKLIFTLQPNTLEQTKLLTITIIDYSEILNEDQLKIITQSLFTNFDSILNKAVPLTKNTESIIIDANINIVFDFWANWRFEQMGDGLMTNIIMNGPPTLVGTKINYLYLMKYKVSAIVREVNSFVQEGNEDDNNEWNYKHEVFFDNSQSEMFNSIFISCENGSKTYFAVENDINEKVSIDKLQELSKRKLQSLIKVKNYIENHKESLTDSFYNKKMNNK